MNLLVIVAILAAFSVNVALARRRKALSPKPRGTFQQMCLSGDGSAYRGYVSETTRGHRCLNWNRFSLPWGPSQGLGNHNYCRNPDRSLMPWCLVRRGTRIVQELCDVPKCSAPTEQPPPDVDTELTCGERSERRMYKVVGGSFTPIESQPWVAAIFKRRQKFLCGGTLISPCWVVTAAHCFSDGDDTNLQDLSVYLGKTALNETDADKEQKFTVEKLIVHKQYNDTTYNNDIALLRIKSRSGGCAAKSASARTACLPPPHTRLPAGIQCSIAGYGRERFMAWHYSQYLKEAQVKLISQADCKRKSYYGDLITDNMFCAGTPDWSTDGCDGDSGGPLVCEVSGRMFLFGVVSWGDGCARENKPGVYTQVTNYNKWIAAKTGLPNYTQGIMYPIK
ncbi:tissue-type plasminogen activator-like [Acanthopagrus latus]|uniref:tissue-type plasminogen activator-like n=1 Tax=Acanthopagrus latus TaxID=8177 RepID=UPI00187C4550|nr:tissue-type plasminogen activator-like [Acanthopagrus latus]